MCSLFWFLVEVFEALLACASLVIIDINRLVLCAYHDIHCWRGCRVLNVRRRRRLNEERCIDFCCTANHGCAASRSCLWRCGGHDLRRWMNHARQHRLGHLRALPLMGLRSYRDQSQPSLELPHRGLFQARRARLFVWRVAPPSPVFLCFTRVRVPYSLRRSAFCLLRFGVKGGIRITADAKRSAPISCFR
jgi:hypothetical protein